jgi:hypothetical protein
MTGEGVKMSLTSSNVYVITDFSCQNKGKRRKSVNEKNRFLTTTEVATLFRQSSRTITEWAHAWTESGGNEGIPGGIRINRRWLFDAQIIDEFIRSRSTRVLFQEAPIRKKIG